MTYYSSKEVLLEFDKLSKKKKIEILESALKLSLENRAGTREYAIAMAMGYSYQDNGQYAK